MNSLNFTTFFFTVSFFIRVQQPHFLHLIAVAAAAVTGQVADPRRLAQQGVA